MGMVVVNPHRYVVPVISGAFHASDKSSQITLSNSNRTATKSSGGTDWETARSAVSHRTGKWYVEGTFNWHTGSFTDAGFSTGTDWLDSYVGSTDNSIALVTDGNVVKSGSGTATLPAFANGDRFGLAIDLDNDKFWCRKNGGAWNNNAGANDPATNLGGIALPAGMTTGTDIFFASGLQVSPFDEQTVNFGETAYTDVAPSGFNPWSMLPSSTVTQSYLNSGGRGNRNSGILTATSNGISWSAAVTNLTNGTYGFDNFWNAAANAVGTDWMKWDFGSAKVIDQFTWFQDNGTTHGTWNFEGSNDNSAWTTLRSALTLGGVQPQYDIANTTAYRYYRLIAAGGSRSNNPWLREIEFRISA